MLPQLSKRAIVLVLMSVSLTFSACDSSGGLSNAENQNTATQKQEDDVMISWKTPDCMTPTKISDLRGMAEGDVLELLGKPEKQEDFTIGGSVSEFRIELLNQFPRPQNNDRVIVERHWSDGDCNLTIWFSEKDDGIVVVDVLTWEDGAEF